MLFTSEKNDENLLNDRIEAFVDGEISTTDLDLLLDELQHDDENSTILQKRIKDSIYHRQIINKAIQPKQLTPVFNFDISYALNDKITEQANVFSDQKNSTILLFNKFISKQKIPLALAASIILATFSFNLTQLVNPSQTTILQKPVAINTKHTSPEIPQVAVSVEKSNSQVLTDEKSLVANQTAKDFNIQSSEHLNLYPKVQESLAPRYVFITQPTSFNSFRVPANQVYLSSPHNRIIFSSAKPNLNPQDYSSALPIQHVKFEK